MGNGSVQGFIILPGDISITYILLGPNHIPEEV